MIDIIKDVLVAGLSDPDIKREVLGWADLDKKTTGETVMFIEGKEMARTAMGLSASSIAANSSYKKAMKTDEKKEPPPDFKKTAKCPHCKETFLLFKKFASGKHSKKAFESCGDCFKKLKEKKEDVNGMEIGGINNREVRINDHLTVAVTCTGSPKHPGRQSVVLGHHIFDSDKWSTLKNESHPSLRLAVSVEESDYAAFGMKSPKITSHEADVVTDTGAQACLLPRKDLHKYGLMRSDLLKVKHTLHAANRTPITIDGALLLRLHGHDDQGTIHSCGIMAYVSPEANSFCQSKLWLN